MPRLAVLVSLLTLLGTIALVPLADVAAQEATPLPLPQFIGLPKGITASEVGPFSQIPSTYRLQFAPAATLPGYDDPTLSLVYVESGVLTVTSEATLAISHIGTDESPQIVDAGTEVTVEKGDYFVLAPHAPTEIRNQGTEPASLQYAMMDPLHPVIVDPNQALG